MKQLLIALSLTLGLCACATFQAADPALDRRAKEFKPVADKAVVYYYRVWRYATRQIASFVNIDGRAMGMAAVNGYCMWELSPGQHRLITFPENAHLVRGAYEMNLEAGKLYFLSEDYQSGYVPIIKPVNAQAGMAAVLDARLIR